MRLAYWTCCTGSLLGRRARDPAAAWLQAGTQVCACVHVCAAPTCVARIRGLLRALPLLFLPPELLLSRKWSRLRCLCCGLPTSIWRMVHLFLVHFRPVSGKLPVCIWRLTAVVPQEHACTHPWSMPHCYSTGGVVLH